MVDARMLYFEVGMKWHSLALLSARMGKLCNILRDRVAVLHEADLV